MFKPVSVSSCSIHLEYGAKHIRILIFGKKDAPITKLYLIRLFDLSYIRLLIIVTCIYFIFILSKRMKRCKKQRYQYHDQSLGFIIFHLARNHIHSEKEQEHIILAGLFIKIYNTLHCSPKYDCNIGLYSTLTEAEFKRTKQFSEPAPGWLKYIGPWISFVSQVSSSPISRGSGAWSNDYRLWVGKEPQLRLGFLNQSNNNC